MPKYSVIVPVYNCGPYLKHCVDSLLGQTYPDFEILLVDDGSTDGSGALCDELAEAHSCIRTFHKENGGAASARNFGLDRAEGKYILFIDGDDTIESDTLVRIDEVVVSYPCDMVIFGLAFDYYAGKDTPERIEHLSVGHQGILPAGFFTTHFKELFDDNALSSACNKVFSAEMIRKAGLRFRENMTMYEDLEFVLRCFCCVDAFYCLALPLYHYRINAANFGHKRVHQLSKLRDNLHCLAETVLTMEPLPTGAADRMGNLYMQLLLRHLLVTKYQKKELDAVYSYCEDTLLRLALEMGATLGQQEGLLLEMIDNRDGSRLLTWLRKKRALTVLRKAVKQALKALGLYH